MFNFSFISCHAFGSFFMIYLYYSSAFVSRSCFRIEIVVASGSWSCGGSGIFRFFMPELPPPMRGMDVASSELVTFLFFVIHHKFCSLLYYGVRAIGSCAGGFGLQG